MVDLVGPGRRDRGDEAGRLKQVPVDQLDPIAEVLGGT
jgi:hypothetical protein